MSIRIALIGAGIMGADHARILARDIPGVALQHVCDADGARARGVADAAGARHASTDPAAAIADAGVDAVLIASPDHTHAPLTMLCLQARKPVLCEKPLSPDPGECRDVVAAEMKAGRRLVQVGFMRRFDPAYLEMKAALAAGRIGSALMMHNFHRNVSAPANFTGQMAITNSAPHEFDIARFVLDTDYVSIAVYRPRLADPAKVGAPVFMVLGTQAGQLVNIEINNNAAYGYDVRGELVGEKGSVMLRAPVASEVHVGLTASTAYPADWRPRFAEAYRRQNAAWVTSIGTGVPAGASAWDGYAATLAADAGVRSLDSGAPVAIDAGTRPAFYEDRS